MRKRVPSFLKTISDQEKQKCLKFEAKVELYDHQDRLKQQLEEKQ